MISKSPLLSFEFATSPGVIKPLLFQNPIEVIVAYNIDEIIPSFRRIENAVQNGYYVAGYLSYEGASAFDPAYKVKHNTQMPLLWFGIFTEPEQQILRSSSSYNLSEWVPSISMEEYQTSIQTIKQYIENGDTYQTNYTIRLNASFQGDDIALFEKLKKAQSSNYCAYLNIGDFQILSASPELFFHLKDNKITTRPMKGTIKRGKTTEDDENRRTELFHSEKNRAENVMIVDLIRNDLGIIAKPGTVNVEQLFEIESYPTVHQMTSIITAEIKDNTTILDIFKALFPCGSITGAPKISTMQVIDQLESTAREVYCGAIGYITPYREAIFNVPIRTALIHQATGKATYGVGGGITWDSTAEDEYHEILAKASILQNERTEFQLLESILLKNGQYYLLEEHLTRLSNSAQYFNFPFNNNEVKEKLSRFAEQNSNGYLKVRLLLNKKGLITLDSQPLNKASGTSSSIVALADRPIDKNDLFLYHKTTNREVYEAFQKEFPDVYDVLLWNEEGEITEFTNGNVVLEIGEGLWTPPRSSGLLAGTFRERLIKEGEIHEKQLYIADLNRCKNIWLINSVREWVKVQLI